MTEAKTRHIQLMHFHGRGNHLRTTIASETPVNAITASPVEDPEHGGAQRIFTYSHSFTDNHLEGRPQVYVFREAITVNLTDIG